LLHLIPERTEDAAQLAKLDPAALDYLLNKASERHRRAIDEARALLDVTLESLEHSASPEHRRRLIERADYELASAQRWCELAANARFCRERPELARQLAGDAGPSTVPAMASRGQQRPRRENRRATTSD